MASKIIFSFLSNLLSLWVAAYIVTGFTISKELQNFLLIGVIFTLINFFIRPVLKILLSPVIIITLGLGIIIVNALLLYILDYFSQNVNIADIWSLLYATLIISVVNAITHFFMKKNAD